MPFSFYLAFSKMKFQSYVRVISKALSYTGVIVPEHIASSFIQKNARIRCSINGNASFQAALIPKGDGNYYIILNQKRRKEWKIVVDQEIHIEISKDNSKYGLPVPEVFQELLYQDPEGNELFHKLSPGKQRSLLYMIGKPKSEQKQLEKAVVILNYLKRSGNRIDFTELNDAFKAARNKH